MLARVEGWSEGGVRTAAATGAGDPFNANAVANLDTGFFSAGAELDDLADTFVATNLTSGGRGWQSRPL